MERNEEIEIVLIDIDNIKNASIKKTEIIIDLLAERLDME